MLLLRPCYRRGNRPNEGDLPTVTPFSLPAEGPLQRPRGSSLCPAPLHFLFLASVLGFWSG